MAQTAGYSPRSAAQKLGVTPGTRLGLIDAEEGWVLDGVAGDLLREVFLPRGLVDVKVAAIDEDWSGLKFVRRKELRATP